MGQTIELKGRTVLDTVAVFDLNRSLTGQNGEAYANAADAEALTSFPAVLARTLFAIDDTIDHVYVAGSSASIRRPGGWDERSLEVVEFEIRNFFIHWADNRA